MIIITDDTLKKLSASLDELAFAVISAKEYLRATEPKSKILPRIEYYEEIVNKQRELAITLSEKVKTNEQESIARIIVIINELSYMFKQDVQEILSSPALNPKLRETSKNCEKQTFSKEQIC